MSKRSRLDCCRGADEVRDQTGWLGQAECAEATSAARTRHHTNSIYPERHCPLVVASTEALIIGLPLLSTERHEAKLIPGRGHSRVLSPTADSGSESTSTHHCHEDFLSLCDNHKGRRGSVDMPKALNSRRVGRSLG